MVYRWVVEPLENGMRLAAATQYYVGAGSGDELLRNLAGIVLVRTGDEETEKEKEAAAGAAGSEPSAAGLARDDEGNALKTVVDPRMSSSARKRAHSLITYPCGENACDMQHVRCVNVCTTLTMSVW